MFSKTVKNNSSRQNKTIRSLTCIITNVLVYTSTQNCISDP